MTFNAPFGRVLTPPFSPALKGGGIVNINESTGTFLNVLSTARSYGNSHTTRGPQLFRYDLSALIGIVAKQAKITFTRGNPSTSVATYTANFYSVSSANGDWVCMPSGNPAPEDVCCYAAKKADGLGGVKVTWAGSDGMQTAGTDYVNTLLGTLIFYRTGTAGDQYVLDLNSDGLTLINGWIQDSANNYGLMTPSAEFSAVTMNFPTVLTITY